LTRALAPFASRSFRYQWPADLFTAWALEMETLILGWYVLVESGSVVLLTVFGALQFIGTLVSPVLGTVGDRIGLRNLLALMRVSYAVFSGAILVMALTGTLNPYAVLAVAALCGLVRPSDIGMRTALVGATVPPASLAAAMGISRTTMDSAKVGGALAGAGLMASFGMAPAYVMIAVLYLIGVVLTLKIEGGRAVPAAAGDPTAPVAAPPRPSPLRDLREGLAYVWTTPRFLAAMSLASLVNLTAFPLSGGLLPYIAKEVYGMGQSGLGWLAASYAIGSLAGSLLMSGLGPSVRPGRMMLAATLAWFVCLAAFGLSPSAGLAMVALAAAGASQSLSMITVQILLLRTAEARLRGRLMGVRMLAIYPLPLGLLIAGAAIPVLGYPLTVAAMLSTGVALLAAIAFGWRRDLIPRDAIANSR
jgi:MFS family permease